MKQLLVQTTPSYLWYLTFAGDKLERVAEYSETRDSLFWAIIQKFMAQPTATLATQDLRTRSTVAH